VRENPLDQLVPEPDVGRRYRATRRARFGDISPGGRLRLDAIARYLQDVSSDDTADSGLENDLAWVVRKLAIEVPRSPRFRERLGLVTWCSGTGSRWAERRISIEGELGSRIEAGVLWVHVDVHSGRPIELAPDFWALYEESAVGRTVRVRLAHPAHPPESATRTPWPLRFTDFDLLGHVNNAAYWAVVEEALADRRDLRSPFRAEVEHRAAIERGQRVDVVRVDAPEQLMLWLVDPDDATVYATAVVRRQPD
jgi:acyl-ACP thioesterase